MVYKDDSLPDTLEQGDLLKRTPKLADLIGKYHPHYASHSDNWLFAVLTQSCDLVQRGGDIGARYISLAPVRPLRAVLHREFETRFANTGHGGQPIASQKTKVALSQFLERLFNNNEAPFFFYPSSRDKGVPDHMCAMLALPISLKPEHYQTFLEAKVAGISDVFQAKLGWLLGQMYSRVGTPDTEPATIKSLTKDFLEGRAVWLDEASYAFVKSEIDLRKTAEAPVFGPSEVASIISSIPKKKTQAIDAIIRIAIQSGVLEDGRSPQRIKLRRFLESDPDLAKLIGK